MQKSQYYLIKMPFNKHRTVAMMSFDSQFVQMEFFSFFSFFFLRIFRKYSDKRNFIDIIPVTFKNSTQNWIW